MNKQITIDPAKLATLKDEVFERAIANTLPQAMRVVLENEAHEAIFRPVADPQILTEVDSNGDVWVGNEYIRVKVNLESFTRDVHTEVASEI